MSDSTEQSGSHKPLAAEGLEPAIPSHLRVPRTLPLHVSRDFVPAHASYSARFRPDIAGLTIAYFGVQCASTEADFDVAFEPILKAFGRAEGPLFWDLASYVDDRGYATRVAAAYWRNQTANHRWEQQLGVDWWYRALQLSGPIGAFREVFRPSMRDAETTFSHRHAEGFARIAEAMSGKTDTHEYWGSARDRIPRAQTDELASVGQPQLPPTDEGGETLGRLVVVTPHDNLCLLRSGQDWSETFGKERDFYLSHVKPYLDAGMTELSDHGLALGCYFNRYLRLDDGGHNERSYSLSAWHSLAALEAWVKADTHLKIWGAGISHYRQAGDSARLRLYHELAVLKAADQSFAYFNCHRRTGMLAAVASDGDSSPD